MTDVHQAPRPSGDAAAVDTYDACIVGAGFAGMYMLHKLRGLGFSAIVYEAAADVVFHLAANIDTDASEEALRVNHEGTDRLLDWLAPVSRGRRIVYASSVAVHDRAAEPKAAITEAAPRPALSRAPIRGWCMSTSARSRPSCRPRNRVSSRGHRSGG